MKYKKDCHDRGFSHRRIFGRKLFCGAIGTLYIRYWNRHIIREKISPAKTFRREWKIVYRKNYTKWGKGEV